MSDNSLKDANMVPAKTACSDLVRAENCDVYRGQTRILKNLCLTIKRGERLAILGPNGCGKTTLVKLLTRELYPKVKTAAYLELFGQREISLSTLREHIGYVSHESQVSYRTLAKGREVLLSAFYGSTGLHQHQHYSDEQYSHVSRCLDARGLSDLAEREFLTLSSGQQRRLLLARASIHQPQLLILDEPTNGLDVKASFEILNDMRDLAETGTALVLISHHVQEIVPEIDRVVLMKDGEILADGLKDEVLTSLALSDLFDTSLTLSRNGSYFQWRPAR